jgi:tRNA(Ile)-lysidine synthase
LAWIDDESNRDHHHRRNFLRHKIAPMLAGAFPGYPETLQRAAEHQAEASALLDVLAAHDGAGALDDAGLALARLAALPAPRARNLLRWFLRCQRLRAPSQARLSDMLRQLIGARSDACTCIAHDGFEIGVHRGRVLVHAPPPKGFAKPWHGEHELELPGGVLRFHGAIGDGFSAATTGEGPLTVRSRSGGERVQLAAGRPRRALKKLMQDAGIPRWQREALPLLWCGDSLVAIPGLGVSVDFQAAAGERGWTLEWRPDIQPNLDQRD